MLIYHIITEKEKEIVSAWSYDGNYKIYDLPPYERQKELKIAFGNPERGNYYSYYDGSILIGFTNMIENEKEVSLGIGVEPSLCGQGYGRQILIQASHISQNLYPGKTLSLEVRAWNQRAISCYEKAGFIIDGMPFEKTTAIGKGEFYRMVKNPLILDEKFDIHKLIER